MIFFTFQIPQMCLGHGWSHYGQGGHFRSPLQSVRAQSLEPGLLPSRVWVSKKLEWGTGAWYQNPDTPMREASILTVDLTSKPNTHSTNTVSSLWIFRIICLCSYGFYFLWWGYLGHFTYLRDRENDGESSHHPLAHFPNACKGGYCARTKLEFKNAISISHMVGRNSII